ncbi:hypothetical protein PJL18_02207 [Paenarthrobacter nicotinovorans]|nr:hypothetical protein [Paenarthrobacter nicotinovorans]
MSMARSAAKTRVRRPRISAMPPTSSSVATMGATTDAPGTPIWVKEAWVPAMVNSLNFCQPCAAKRNPAMTRRMVRAVVVKLDLFILQPLQPVG